MSKLSGGNYAVEHGMAPVAGGISIYIFHGDAFYGKCENKLSTQAIKQPSIVNISNTKVIGNMAIITIGGL